MQENTLAHEVAINAPVSRVWEILVDFARYPEWNPTLAYVSGEAVVGAALLTRAGIGTPGEREFPGTVVAVEPGELLVTEGGMPELLYGRHHWELTADGAGTRLRNRETLTGSMAADVLAAGRAALEAEFAAFNRALKEVAEAGGFPVPS
ncbi:SRPBCC family protein [Longispora urticae]